MKTDKYDMHHNKNQITIYDQQYGPHTNKIHKM